MFAWVLSCFLQLLVNNGLSLYDVLYKSNTISPHGFMTLSLNFTCCPPLSCAHSPHHLWYVPTLLSHQKTSDVGSSWSQWKSSPLWSSSVTDNCVWCKAPQAHIMWCASQVIHNPRHQWGETPASHSAQWVSIFKDSRKRSEAGDNNTTNTVQNAKNWFDAIMSCNQLTQKQKRKTTSYT